MILNKPRKAKYFDDLENPCTNKGFHEHDLLKSKEFS